MSVRRVLTALAAVFSAYLASRGLVPSPLVVRPVLLWAGVALYAAVTLLVLAAPSSRSDPRRGAPLPHAAAAVAVTASAALPWIVSAASGRVGVADPHVTWYIGAVGVLMTIVMVRRRPVWAWAGIALLAASSSILLGADGALAFGLVGSTLWVAVGQLVQFFTDRVYTDTVKLAGLQQASAAWQSTQLVGRRERRERVRFALEVAGPVLTRVISSGGALTEEERAEAWLAEGTLRDELRAARLLDDDVRAAIAALRRRGATVTMLDEGGAEGLDDVAWTGIRGELAEVLRTAEASRLIVRTAVHPEIAVTVVGRAEPDAASPDEDDVVLWHEIARR